MTVDLSEHRPVAACLADGSGYTGDYCLFDGEDWPCPAVAQAALRAEVLAHPIAGPIQRAYEADSTTLLTVAPGISFLIPTEPLIDVEGPGWIRHAHEGEGGWCERKTCRARRSEHLS